MVKNNQQNAVLQSLLSRMRTNDDFPALSTTISEINKTVSSDHSSLNSLTKIILQDFSLTKKLLKLVNTVSYGQFGGKITTISKAVFILGFDMVRDIATALILIEFLQNKSQAIQLTDEVITAFFVGLIARQLSADLNLRNHEEAMICGIFNHLGRLLSIFYFFDQSEKINKLIADGTPPNKASYEVLGISYNDLGAGVAKSWNFPTRLLQGMQSLPSDRVDHPANELELMNITVNLANELTALVAIERADNKKVTEQIKQLVKKYKPAIHLDEKQLNHTLEISMQEMAVRASILSISTKDSLFLKRVEAYTGFVIQYEVTSKLNDDIDNMSIDQLAGIDILNINEKLDTESILQAGIQDVINALVGDCKVDDVIKKVLEVMYKGMGFNRTFMLVSDARTNVMRARSGFGEDIDAVMPLFRFPLKTAPDVFHLAIEKGVDIIIEDVTDKTISSKIPNWYTLISQAKSFLLLPVMVNQKVVGCLYADFDTVNSLEAASKSLGMLRTLRNQVVLAIKQS